MNETRYLCVDHSGAYGERIYWCVGGGTENGVVKLKTDGAEVIMTAVAGPLALSIKPSI